MARRLFLASKLRTPSQVVRLSTTSLANAYLSGSLLTKKWAGMRGRVARPPLTCTAEKPRPARRLIAVRVVEIEPDRAVVAQVALGGQIAAECVAAEVAAGARDGDVAAARQ